MYDKKRLIIIRAALILIGAAVGGTALWQYFVYYPDIVRREIQIGIIAVSAAVFAAIFGLSAKPFYRLGGAIGGQFSNIYSTLGARGIVAIVAGLACAGLTTYLFDVMIRDAVDIIAVRVLADGLAAVLCVALFCYGFVKWISTDAQSETEIPAAPRGYLLTASCFADDRVYAAADFAVNAKVSSATFKAVWEYCDITACERLKAVVASGAVKTVKNSENFETAGEYDEIELRTARGKRLVPVCGDSEVFGKIDGAANIGVFAIPSAETLRLFDRSDENATAHENSSDDETRGDIIIDK